jgi:hypothetical protein
MMQAKTKMDATTKLMNKKKEKTLGIIYKKKKKKKKTLGVST